MQTTIKELRTIPGVGVSIAQDLLDLGIHTISDLKHRNPERLYDTLCAQKNGHIDRCVLYVFRCAVYYASQKNHDPALLKWWSWKD